MNKTKKVAIICAAIIAAVLIVPAVKFLPKLNGASPAGEPTSKYEYTTLVPYVDAQTQVLTPTTAKLKPEFTTRYEENASRLSQTKGWQDNDLTLGIPKIKTGSISTVEYVTDRGRRTVIRIDTLGYDSYLSYVAQLEQAGFSDNNAKAHIPAAEPSKVAMFYSKFDGTRSFGVYWYGNESEAGFDCEIVISDYEQAK